MREPSKLRSAIKYLAYRLITPVKADRLRNLYNIKDKYIYNKKLARKVLELVEERNTDLPVSDDIGLLKKLHELFSTINLSKCYELNNMLNAARNRYRYLLSFNIDLVGKDIVDFGAGHGENLMLVNEFNLNSCTGYDFSDKNFNKHKDDLEPEVLNAIEFKTADLVTDDIGRENCDIIMSFSAFEHFADPGEVLSRCYQALRPGGYLYAEFAAFNAPFATHRKIYSGVPYAQNIFKDKVAYEFFYKKLKINDEVNRYTNEKIIDGNPYPEVNRWKIEDYEKVFLDREHWDIVNYTKVYNYQYDWFVKIFSKEFDGLSKDDVYADYLKFLIRKNPAVS